jgi:isopentenyl-diphosphate delta-isomerase
LDQVVLVDALGHVCRSGGEIQALERRAAHQQGILHLAVSVFVFNSQGELILQRRSWRKECSAWRWANTSCTHPRPDEDLLTAASRCLSLEMGLSCELREVGVCLYRCDVGYGLTEHEYDHLFIGDSDALPSPDDQEVVEWRAMDFKELGQDLERLPFDYAPWLIQTYPVVRRLL